MSKFKPGPGSTRNGEAPAGQTPRSPEPIKPPVAPPPPATTWLDGLTDWVGDNWVNIVLLAALICVIIFFWDDLGTAWRESTH